jgi:hypothetical protein
MQVLAHGNIWTLGSQFSIWSVVFLASVRIVYLLNLQAAPSNVKSLPKQS